MGEEGNTERQGGDSPRTSRKAGWRCALDAAREAGRGLLAPWFGLTAAEQDAVLAVMALFAFGLAVRWWLTRS